MIKAYSSPQDIRVTFTSDTGEEIQALCVAVFSCEHPLYQFNSYCALYSESFDKEHPIWLCRVNRTDDKDICSYEIITEKDEAQAVFRTYNNLITMMERNQIEGVWLPDVTDTEGSTGEG